MTTRQSYQRAAWIDRFNRPTWKDLRAGLAAPHSKLFDRLRRQLGDLEGVDCDFRWYGECWKWAVEYGFARCGEPLAVVIPAPQDLQLAMPLDSEFLASLAQRSLRRTVREGLNLVEDPFDTRWSVWSIYSSGLVDELLDVVELKRQHLRHHAG